MLFIEASKMPGKGNVVITGNLKSVMQESAGAAVSFVRSKAAVLGLDPEFRRPSISTFTSPRGARRRTGRAPA